MLTYVRKELMYIEISYAKLGKESGFYVQKFIDNSSDRFWGIFEKKKI